MSSGVTLLLSGVPRNVTLLELSYYLECLFGTNTEIGTFDIRDLPQQSSKRQIALDFSSGFDAIAAQEKLDGYRYEMSNGQEYTLCAKISKKTEVLRNESLSPVPSYDEPGVVGSSTMALIPSFSRRDVYKVNAKLDAQLELMKKQKMVIRAERELVKERRRLKRERDFDSDEFGGPSKARRRSESSCSRETRSRSRSQERRRRHPVTSTALQNQCKSQAMPQCVDIPNVTIGTRVYPMEYHNSAVRRSTSSEYDMEERRLSSRNSRGTPCSPDRSRADRSKLRRRRTKDRRSRSKESSKHSISKSKETSRHSRSKFKKTARQSRSKSKESSRHSRSKSKETSRHSRSKSKEAARQSRSKSKESCRHSRSKSKETTRHSRSKFKETARHSRSKSKDSSRHSRSKSKETSRHSRSKFKETARHSRSKSKDSSRHSRSKSKETSRHSRSKSKEAARQSRSKSKESCRHSRSKSKETTRHSRSKSRGRTSRSKETSRRHRSKPKKTRKHRRSRSKKTTRSRKTSRYRRSSSSDRKSTSKETSRHRRSRSKGTSRRRRSRSRGASKDRRSRSKGSSRDRRSSSEESSRDRRSRSKGTPRERTSRSKENYREQRSRSRDRRAKKRRSRRRWDSGYKDSRWRFRSRSRSPSRDYRFYRSRSRSREYGYRKPSCLTEYRPRYSSSQSNAIERGSRPLAIMNSPAQYQTSIVRVIRDRVDYSEVDFHNEIDHFSVNDEQDENSSMSDSKTGTEPKLSSEIINQLPEAIDRLTQKKLQCATITSNNANCSQSKSALNTSSSIIKANSKITPKNKTAQPIPIKDPNVDKILLPVPSCSNYTGIGSAGQVSPKKKKKHPSRSARKALKTSTRVEQASTFVKMLMHIIRDEIAIKNGITISDSEKYKLDDKLKAVINMRVKPLVEANESDTEVLLDYRRYYSKEEDTFLVKRLLDAIRETTYRRAKYSSAGVHTRGTTTTLTFVDLSTDLEDSPVKGVEIVELDNDVTPKTTYLDNIPYGPLTLAEINATKENRDKNVVTTTPQQTTDLDVTPQRKQLPARPKFVLVVKKLLKEMKPVLYNCKEANVNWNLLCKIKQVLRIIIGDMLKGKDYMPKKEILKHFRSLYPRDKDVEFINNVRRDLDNGKYDLEISDTVDLADKPYDDEVIFVATKCDVITVADSDDDKEEQDTKNDVAGAVIPKDTPNEKQEITQQEESTLQSEKETEELCAQQAATEVNAQCEEIEKDKGIQLVHENNKEELVQKTDPDQPENLVEHNMLNNIMFSNIIKEETETIEYFHNAEDDSRSNDVEKETPLVSAITIMTSTSELLSLKYSNEKDGDIKSEDNNEGYEQETRRDEEEQEEETIEAIIKCVESFGEKETEELCAKQAATEVNAQFEEMEKDKGIEHVHENNKEEVVQKSEPVQTENLVEHIKEETETIEYFHNAEDDSRNSDVEKESPLVTAITIMTSTSELLSLNYSNEKDGDIKSEDNNEGYGQETRKDKEEEETIEAIIKCVEFFVEKETEELCAQQAATEVNAQFEEMEADKGIKHVHENNKEELVQKSEPVQPEKLVEHIKEETETVDDFHNAEDDSRSNDVEKETPLVSAITIMTSTSELLSLKYSNEKDGDIKSEDNNEGYEQETRRDEEEQEEETIEAIIKCVESFGKGSYTSK